jgi:hypothetical protein
MVRDVCISHRVWQTPAAVPSSSRTDKSMRPRRPQKKNRLIAPLLQDRNLFFVDIKSIYRPLVQSSALLLLLHVVADALVVVLAAAATAATAVVVVVVVADKPSLWVPSMDDQTKDDKFVLDVVETSERFICDMRCGYHMIRIVSYYPRGPSCHDGRVVRLLLWLCASGREREGGRLNRFYHCLNLTRRYFAVEKILSMHGDPCRSFFLRVILLQVQPPYCRHKKMNDYFFPFRTVAHDKKAKCSLDFT